MIEVCTTNHLVDGLAEAKLLAHYLEGKRGFFVDVFWGRLAVLSGATWTCRAAWFRCCRANAANTPPY